MILILDRKLFSLALIATILIVPFIFIPASSNAASSSDFSNANSAINSAFNATLNAQQKGANVTDLVAKLNIAVGLVQKAQAENATNPGLATSDLQNATQIAGQVSSAAPSLGQSGANARTIQYSISIGASIVIIAVAALIYIYGGRIYHLLWFYLYKDYIVRSSKE